MATSSLTFPSLFDAADEMSRAAQSRYVGATGARLVLAVVAGVLAAFAGEAVSGKVEVVSLMAAIAFLLALAMEVWLLADGPERTWYDGRALAESTKTLSWRYAAGGLPFPVAATDAEQDFVEQVAALLEDAPSIDVGAGAGPAVTPEMSAMRGADLPARRAAYLDGRIRDQQLWYSDKAGRHRSRAMWWKLFLIGIEVLGMGAALSNAFGVTDIDLASAISAAIGGGAAWLAVKQHDSLSRAYTFASHELAIVATRLQGVDNEHQWAAEVAGAEEAISREHTMWRAARVVLPPRRPASG